ncbi:hypothetical protein [Streptomyces sp. URMC 124]|uniref:hypothetical protein n=1 Tax=Streptomyces sp. URMC 124 TaxID=3423405 RepID=UPI003F1A7B59
MGSLLRRQEIAARVSYYKFCLQESDDHLIPTLYPDETEHGVFLSTFPMRVDFESAGRSHTAALEVEVWDSLPDDDPREWDEVAETSIETASGELSLWGIGRAEGVTLGAAGTWRLRAAAAGREAVRRETQDQGFAHGTERWLLQFWPEEP